MLKFIRRLILNLGWVAVVYFATIQDIKIAQNFAAFYTWVMFIIIIIILFSKEGLKAWKDGSVLPKWLCHMLYWTIITLFVIDGWFLFGTFWFIIYMVGCFND